MDAQASSEVSRQPYSNAHGPRRNILIQSRPRSRPRSSLRERKKQQTRAAIIARAVDLFNSQGFYNTSIDDIADAADVSRGTFFNYFGYKEAVIVEFGRDLIATLTAAVDEELQAGVGAERIIRGIWERVRALLAEHGEAVVVLAHELLNPEVERAVRAAQAFTLAGLVAKVAAAGKASGRFRAGVDAGVFGEVVANLIVVGVATQYRTDDEVGGAGYMKQSLGMILHGAMPEGVARPDDWAT